MDKVIVTPEAHNKYWLELRALLPNIAEELACSVDELAVFDYFRFPCDYMASEFRDRPYKFAGPFTKMPLIQVRRKNGIGPIGYGLTYYQSKLDATLKYGVFTEKGDWGDFSWIVIQKNKVFKFRRLGLKLNQLANPTREIPFLAEGILESIIRNSIGFLKNSKKIEKYGVKIKRGLILGGPPGNGKTLTCRYIQKLCSQRGYRWGVITSADIDKAYQDKELSDLFRMFTVTFFDDIDISYMDRSKGNGKLACSLLTAMDGIFDSGHLVRIFTTNEELEGLDPAFLRPGRIDQCYTLENPEADLRRQLVTSIWPQEIQENIDIEQLIEESDGYSFAELEAIRTFLVTNKILGDGTWDLDNAFREFNLRKEEKKFKSKKRTGFGEVLNKGKYNAKVSRQSSSHPDRPCQGPIPPAGL